MMLRCSPNGLNSSRCARALCCREGIYTVYTYIIKIDLFSYRNCLRKKQCYHRLIIVIEVGRTTDHPLNKRFHMNFGVHIWTVF